MGLMNSTAETAEMDSTAEITKLRKAMPFKLDHDPYILSALKVANQRWRLLVEPIGNGEVVYRLLHTIQPAANLDDVVYQHTDRSSKDFAEILKSLLFYRGLVACRELFNVAFGTDDVAEMAMQDGLAKYKSELTDQLELPRFVKNVMNSIKHD